MTITISDAVLREHSARMRKFLEEDATESTNSRLTAEEQRALDDGLMRFVFHDGPRSNWAMIGRLSHVAKANT